VKARLVITLLLAAQTVQAQVGYQPDASPYRDKDFNRDWTLFMGQYTAEPDPVGVAPKAGPMAGVRWQMYLTGPLYFAVRLAGASVERTEIDPTKPLATRVVQKEQVPILLADAALEMSLTGHRTWHGLSPLINAGVGFAADVRGRTDVGDYRFGIPFTMTFGTTMTWSPNDTWGLRLDWSNYVYRISYPGSYYVKSTQDPAPRTTGQANSFWRRNHALMLGVSLHYPRR
jgi:hypothetical protein